MTVIRGGGLLWHIRSGGGRNSKLCLPYVKHSVHSHPRP